MSRAADIPKITRGLFKQAAEKAKSLIILDASKGKFQNDKSGFSYASPENPYSYVRYKARSMRKYGRGLKKTGRGDRIKGFKGKSLDTTTSFVNMKLTGETLRRISAKSIKDGFKLVFANGDIIEGNAERGYVLADLRDKNYRVIEDMIGRQLDKNINAYTVKAETFEIGG